MKQKEITIQTTGRGTYEFTRRVSEWVTGETAQLRDVPANGLCHLFLQHTSASLILCENADPDVRKDLETFMSDLVPDGRKGFIHTMEGPDDMPAHVRTILTDAELTIPVRDGRLALGTWQGIYLWEHRHAPHTRSVIATLQL
jgi:secondary thiamine-phosphate synthase enzyme